ncbi:MAG: hypothetical protein LBT26_05850 [Clostridiales Family XIII bacterium]|jgi:hypothetical protein|nr:hypothetical protein [Clostridiales Family XIII bacterium]
MTEKQAQALLDEGYALMAEFGFGSLSGRDRDAVIQKALQVLGAIARAPEIAAACQAFFLSRKLYEMDGHNGARVLLGDYFISLAVKLVLPLENRQLLEDLSLRLKDYAVDSSRYLARFDFDAYLETVDTVCKGYIKSERNASQRQ